MKFFTHTTAIKTTVFNCFWVTVFTLLVCFNAKSQRFQHPGIPFTKYDLEQLKANITKEPWLSAYNNFKNAAHSQLSYGMKGPHATVTRAPNLNNVAWIEDMKAVLNLSFMWIFTGDSAYARKATNMLDAWAVTNTTWGGNENMLDIGDYADSWGTGAEILRHTFPGWSQANTDHVKNYFANVLFPTSWVPFQTRDANKGALQLKIALAASVFCDDTARFNQAIDVYRMDAGGGMRNSLPNGQVGDAGRDDHWRVQAAALVWGAEVAYKQGIDMYEELDKRVLAIGELYHKFAFEGDTMTFIPFGNYSSYWTNWGVPTGIRKGDMTNTIQAAYALRKGIPTPYTEKMRAALGGAGGDFLYLKSSDTSTATPLPPVYYPAEHVQPVSHLTNTDIGNPGLAGSASYSNGMWTVKGAGNSLSNAMNYTFRKMSGDAGLIVQVTGMSLSSSACGVMVRQSLAPGSPYWNIQLAAGGGIGPHWQAKAPWWLKMERVGNRIFTYHSQDGINWTSLNCFYSTTRPDDLYYGFYTISNNTSALNTATFTNVGYSQAAPAGSPEINSATSATTPIGTAFNYTITASGNPASYSASGLPAGLTLDATTGIISGTPGAIGQNEITLGATNANGTGTATLILSIINNQAPAVPDSVVASILNTTQIRLTWKPSANATGYSVKRATVSGGSYTTIQTGITGTNFSDAAPVPEINNFYVVTALTGNLESTISNEVFASVPPAVPGKPVVTSKNGSVDLVWDTAHGAASYNVKRATISGGPYTTIANVTAHSYTDVNVTNGSPYYYVISSKGVTKESANSAEAFAVPGSSSFTWSADPDSVNWNDAANWIEHSVPTNPAVITFKASADTVLTNDITGLEASRIQFDADANQYTIDGNSIALNNDLVNNSGYSQTISTPLVLNKTLNVSPTTANITVSGSISGTGTLMKSGNTGVLTLSGNNTYSGGTIIRGFTAAWPPTNGIIVRGSGTGTLSNPTSGPLGTGKIIFNGGALWAEGGDVKLYNDVEIPAGQTGWFFQTSSGIFLYSKITGSGTFQQDGNITNGLHLYGDNSGFTGLFISRFRSGASRTRFEVPESGSANANWLLDANATDCQSLQFRSGTIHFGSLSGRGYIRNNGGGSPTISIGALNKNTNYGGTIGNATGGNVQVEKVGTGTLEMWGNQAYGGTTTVKNGKLLLVNSATTGVWPSPVVDSSGTFGGTGLSQAAITIGTGTAATAILEPGNNGIGTLTTTNTLTLNSNAICKVEISVKNGTADKVKASSVTLAGNPVLSVTDIDSGALAAGTALTLIDNTGSTAVTGIFKDLPELSLVTVNGYDFRITYKGGTGNDVVLMDDRTLPVTISSAGADTTLVGRSYTYAITAIKSPTSFQATGLPAGLSIDSATGIISGTPTVAGMFPVTLIASNDISTGTTTLNLVVKSNVVDGVIVAAGDGKNIIEWDPILNLRYQVKRSVAPEGPFTTLANSISARYTDSAVNNGSTYYYVVAAIDSTIEYPNSLAVAAIPNIGQHGYWKFNENSGTKAIDAWGANHGTLGATASRDTGYAERSLKLNGTATAYSSLPTGLVSTLKDFTVSTWVRMDAISTWMRVFDFGSGTNKYLFLTVQAGVVSGKQTIRYAIKNGGSEQQVNFNYALTLNTWTHFAVTQSGNTASLYINGALVASNTGVTIKPATLENTNQNYIGKSQWNDPLFKGSIDEFKIYNRALTAAEIAEVKKVDQLITFNALPEKKIGDVDFDPAATASSGLPVSYSSSDTNVAIISPEGKVKIAGSGTTFITASQTGNEKYKAASSVTRQLQVYIPPYVVAKNIEVAVEADGKVFITPQQVDDGSVSYSGALTLSLDKIDFTCADIDSPITVTLTATDADGHSSSGTAQVTVVDKQQPAVTAPADQFYCYSDAGSYTIPALTASDNCGIASVNYSISGATARSGNGSDASGSFNAGESTIVWTVTDIHGNVSTANTIVTVNAPLTVTIPDVYAINPDVDLKNTLYLGYGPSSFTLNATAAGGTEPYTYQWSSGATTASIQVSSAGTYTVTITDAKGCEQTASISIQVLDVRCGNNNDKVMICHNNKTICISSADVQDHLNHGDYLGACNVTASRPVNTNAAVASVEPVKEGTIVYPNPVANRLTIKVDRLQEGALVKVYNVNGAVVASARLTNTTQSLPVQTLAAGIYYVQVINGGVITTKKIIKQ